MPARRGTDQRRRPERADAARNRRRVLAAAEELFARRGAREVTMEEIARAAGVGKGTLYRRFPDRAAIAVALLDEHERALQQRLLAGAPPLGPGAPPPERLAAFYAAMVALLERHAHLALAIEAGERRFATGAYGFWRARRDALVDALLAPLAPEVYQYQRGRGRTPAEITRALAYLAERALGPPPAGVRS